MLKPLSGKIGVTGPTGPIGITGPIGRVGSTLDVRLPKFFAPQYNGPIAEFIQLLIVQPTPFCNIQCDYCYLPDRDSAARLERDTFRELLEKVFASGLVGETLSVVWHAGEPLVLPPSYYADLFQAIDQLSIPRSRLRHSVQTNGMLISEPWCDFIRQESINLGLSIDGPAFLHDRHR